MKCPNCGAEATAVREPIAIAVGPREVTVEADFNKCATCGEIFYLAGQMDAAQRSAVNAIRVEDGLLSPDDIVALRKRLNFTQAQLEQRLGVGAKTVVRWERGTVCQTAVADHTLRVFAAYPYLVPFFQGASAIQLKDKIQGFQRVFADAESKVVISAAAESMVTSATGDQPFVTTKEKIVVARALGAVPVEAANSNLAMAA